jgi:hypothetical protein
MRRIMLTVRRGVLQVNMEDELELLSFVFVMKTKVKAPRKDGVYAM